MGKKLKMNGGCPNHSVISCICSAMKYTPTLLFTHHIFLKSLMVNKAMYSEMIFAIRSKGMGSWTKEVFII